MKTEEIKNALLSAHRYFCNKDCTNCMFNTVYDGIDYDCLEDLIDALICDLEEDE